MSNVNFSKINKRMVEMGRFGGIAGAYSGVAGGPITAITTGIFGGAFFGSIGILVGTVEVIVDEVSKSAKS